MRGSPAELGDAYRYVINIQGDEPFIDPGQIDILASVLRDGTTEIATLIILVDDKDVLFDIGEVKVVLNPKMEALYFSRSVIPYLKMSLEVNGIFDVPITGMLACTHTGGCACGCAPVTQHPQTASCHDREALRTVSRRSDDSEGPVSAHWWSYASQCCSCRVRAYRPMDLGSRPGKAGPTPFGFPKPAAPAQVAVTQSAVG